MMDIEMRFHMAMISIYEVAKDEFHDNATRFLQMLSEKCGFLALGFIRQLPTATNANR